VPVEIKGIVEFKKALHQFAPDLEKELNHEIRAALQPIVKTARSYALADIPGLSKWKGTGGKKITASTSMFRQGSFPLYSPDKARAGIKYSVGNTKKNYNGFVTAYSIKNTSASGAIYETAGRKNPSGQPPAPPHTAGKNYSHSNNPSAGLHFINSLGQMKGTGKMRGRLIFRAWEEDHGRALGHAVKAIEKTSTIFKKRMDVYSVFRSAA